MLANHHHEAVGVGGGQMAHPKRPGGDYGQQTGWLPCSLPAGQCGDCPITPQASGRVGGRWARRLQASALLHSPGLPPASFVATCFTGPAALHTAFFPSWIFLDFNLYLRNVLFPGPRPLALCPLPAWCSPNYLWRRTWFVLVCF